MKHELDEGAGGAAKLGLIVLSTDQTLEWEARRILCGHDANLMHSRIESAPMVTPDSLRDMGGRLETAARLLPSPLRAIGYGCTSASVMLGPAEVAGIVGRAHPETPVANPISAVAAALNALGARRVGLVTPYAPEVARPVAEFLGGAGFEIARETGFGEGDDRRVARIREQDTLRAIEHVGRGVDAVFASCTNLRTLGVIDDAERRLGVPVVSSNSALIWHLLGLAGAGIPQSGPGALYRRRP